MTTFASLGLIQPLQRALSEEGYQTPTPIQAQAIPTLLTGRDMIGCAQTGTGKTAAFALPVLQHLAEHPSAGGRPRIRVLVLTPTRELAAQISESFAAYGKYLPVRHLVIFGGVKENPQIRALRAGVDIVVATPGRLLDLYGRDYVDLEAVEVFILDEADRMLDMGFVHDVRRVLRALPAKRQSLLFSATMPREIVELAASFLSDPVQVEVTPPATTVELIQQSVMFVDRPDKKRLLAEILHGDDVVRALVFTRTKHGANRLATQLGREHLHAAAIHGNKSQNSRRRALEGFKLGEIPVLIATDIAARGIDVDGISHVFNYELPNVPETYVHRIGRTGRAGASGIAISFCDETEGEYLRDIERLIGFGVPVVTDHAYHSAAAVPSPGRPRGGSGRSGGSRSSTRGGRGGGGRSGGGRSGERSGGRSGERSGGGRNGERSGGRGGARGHGRGGARGGAAGASRGGATTGSRGSGRSAILFDSRGGAGDAGGARPSASDARGLPTFSPRGGGKGGAGGGKGGAGDRKGGADSSSGGGPRRRRRR